MKKIVLLILLLVAIVAVPVMAKPYEVTVTVKDSAGVPYPACYVGILPSDLSGPSMDYQTNVRGKTTVSLDSTWKIYSVFDVYVNPNANSCTLGSGCSRFTPFSFGKQLSGRLTIDYPCVVGETECGSSCFNLKTNVNNCGSCGTACLFPHASASCYSGLCMMGSCTAGYGNCDESSGNGCERALNTVTNCGSCGNECPIPEEDGNRHRECNNGACSIACDAGYLNCDTDPTNCEVYGSTDTNNCGSCGNVCSVPNAVQSCYAGSCGIGSCNTGYGDCNYAVSDGCEVNLDTDINNCGSCEYSCGNANGEASCVSGVCEFACPEGYANCDYNDANGCEVDLNSDTFNCGECDNVCPNAHGTASCDSGLCGMSDCDSGWGDCNTVSLSSFGFGVQGVPLDGCETDLTSDALHCGSCGNACSNNNGDPSCFGGACSISCYEYYGNCDDNVSNGCEEYLVDNDLNCGACGNTCGSEEYCNKNTCDPKT